MQERIKALRKVLNLTQAKFAEQLKVKPNTISQYESGRNEPIDAVVSLICREFNVNEEWLRTGKGEMFKATPDDAIDALIEQYGVSKDVRVLIEKLLELKPEEQLALVTYVKKIAAAFNKENLQPAVSDPTPQDLPEDDRLAALAADAPADLTDADIEARVQEFRRQLLDEKEAAARSSASGASGRKQA